MVDPDDDDRVASTMMNLRTVQDDPEAKAILATVRRRLAEVDAPHRIDRFVLLERRGAGGMGIVYAAYDPDLDRRVALKLLLPSGPGSTASEERRLLDEARALAKLSHPNVIPVYEVGQVDGRVYIAMELVEGRSLRAWLTAERRSWREILEAFRAAGRGLAAAHAADLVHRDFKPDNVLVGDDDRVRVVDFGLAQPVTALAEAEQSGEVAGTVAYMPPEQARGEPSEAAGDQFSFCVSLYEGLYGLRPFAGETRDDYIRAIERGSPRVPTDSRGVPDWIRPVLLRGLSPRASDRHASMDALLTELSHDPEATRRRRARTLTAALVFGGAGIIAGSVWSSRTPPCPAADPTLGGVWSEDARLGVRGAFEATELAYAPRALDGVTAALDDRAQRIAAMRVDACRATHVRLEQSEQMLDLRMACLDDEVADLSTLVEIFNDADATIVEGSTAAMLALPDLERCADLEALRATESLDGDLGESDRERAAELRKKLSQARLLAALERYEEARTLSRSVGEEASAGTLASVAAEAAHVDGYVAIQAHDYDAARQALERALSLAGKAQHGLVVMRTFSDLIWVAGAQGKLDEARQWAQSARAALDLEDASIEDRARYHVNFGNALVTNGDLDEAREHHERALEWTIQRYGEDHHAVARDLGNLGATMARLGRNEEAKTLFERALAIRKATLGPDHPSVARSRNNLALSLSALGDHARAREELERSLAVLESLHASDDPSILQSSTNLAFELAALGELESALARHQKVCAVYDRVRGQEPLHAAGAYNGLGDVLVDLARADEALVAFDRAKEILDRTLPADSPLHVETLRGKGRALALAGRGEEALTVLGRAATLDEVGLGRDHPSVAETLVIRGRVLTQLGRTEQARADLERAMRALNDADVDPLLRKQANTALEDLQQAAAD